MSNPRENRIISYETTSVWLDDATYWLNLISRPADTNLEPGRLSRQDLEGIVNSSIDLSSQIVNYDRNIQAGLSFLNERGNRRLRRMNDVIKSYNNILDEVSYYLIENTILAQKLLIKLPKLVTSQANPEIAEIDDTPFNVISPNFARSYGIREVVSGALGLSITLSHALNSTPNTINSEQLDIQSANYALRQLAFENGFDLANLDQFMVELLRAGTLREVLNNLKDREYLDKMVSMATKTNIDNLENKEFDAPAQQQTEPKQVYAEGGNFWNGPSSASGKVNSGFDTGVNYFVTNIAFNGENISGSTIWIEIVNKEGETAWISHVRSRSGVADISLDQVIDDFLLNKYRKIFETETPTTEDVSPNSATIRLSRATGGAFSPNFDQLHDREKLAIQQVYEAKIANLEYLNTSILNGEAEVKLFTLSTQDNEGNGFANKAVALLVKGNKFYWPVLGNNALTDRPDDFYDVTSVREILIPEGFEGQVYIDQHGRVELQMTFDGENVGVFNPQREAWELIEDNLPEWLEALKTDTQLLSDILNGTSSLKDLFPDQFANTDGVVAEVTAAFIDTNTLGNMIFTNTSYPEGNEYSVNNMILEEITLERVDGHIETSVKYLYKVGGEIKRVIFKNGPITVYNGDSREKIDENNITRVRIGRKMTTYFNEFKPDSDNDYRTNCAFLNGNQSPSLEACSQHIAENMTNPIPSLQNFQNKLLNNPGEIVITDLIVTTFNSQ